jgi:hypothetical protein
MVGKRLMKLIYALIIVRLILIAIIVLQKFFIQQPIGTFSTVAFSALLFYRSLLFFRYMFADDKNGKPYKTYGWPWSLQY